MPLDFGPVFAGISGPPISLAAARFRTLAAIGGAAVFVALRSGSVLGCDGGALVLPGSTASARTLCVFCHTSNLLSEIILL